MSELKCEVCGDQLPPNGNYLHNVRGGLVHSYCALERECKRLQEIIVKEGTKWHEHHTNPDKKRYWKDFARSAYR